MVAVRVSSERPAMCLLLSERVKGSQDQPARVLKGSSSLSRWVELKLSLLLLIDDGVTKLKLPWGERSSGCTGQSPHALLGRKFNIVKATAVLLKKSFEVFRTRTWRLIH